MRVRTAIWIEDSNGHVVYGLGRQQILEAIQASGSIKAAAAQLGMSYRGLWARLRHSERRLSLSLVESHPGRGAHRGTTLTPEAAALMDAFAKLTRDAREASDASFQRHVRALLDTDAPD
jgi:molybdate transport system regulatory protein